MATTIAQALLDRFANSGITDFDGSGGMWLEEIPATATPILPLFGFTHQGEQCQFTTELDYVETGSFEFSIFALGVAEAERLGLVVKALFDPLIKSPNQLAITNAKMISFDRQSGQVGVEGFRQADGKAVGRVTFVYAYEVERKLAS